jgi:hypothetical protein
MSEKLAPRISLKRIFIILAVIGLTLFSLSSLFQQINFNKEFNSRLWKDKSTSLSVDKDLITLRQRMVNDLVKNVLPGLTRVEAVSLLGNPDDSGAEFDWALLYRLADYKTIGTDMMCLVVIFDGKSEVYKDYEIYDHCG